MKKIKFLMPTLIASQALVVLPLTSCGNSSNELSIYTPEGGNVISGNETSNILYVNLKNKLNDGESLICNLVNTSAPFKFKTQVSIWNNIGIVTYEKTADCVANKTYEVELEFKCIDKSNNTKWTIKASTSIIYTDHISYTGSKEQWTGGESSSYDGTYTYTFNLVDNLPTNGKLKVNLIRTDGSDSVYASTPLEPTVNDKEVKVKVGVAKQTATGTTTPTNGEYVDFNLKFICVDSSEQETWSKTISGFKLMYTAQLVVIDTSKFTVSGDSLTKVDLSAIPANCNTLEIKHSFTNANGDAITINSIADDFWTNSIATTTQEKANQIKNLVLDWDSTGCCRSIGKRAFYKSNLQVIDVSSIPNSVRGLSTILDIAAKDSSTGLDGAFQGFESTSGKIKWGDDFSQYKKHIVKSKLYNAGVGAGWFDTVQVTSREQLVEALDSGATVKIMNNIDISTGKADEYTGQIDVYTSSIIDLNGFSLYSSKPIYNVNTNQCALLCVWNGAELAITDSSADAEHPYGKGSIKPFSSALEKTALPTRAIDVVSDHPLKEQSTLDILGGNIYGNLNIISNKNSNVYIEGGQFELLQTSLTLPDQLKYDEMFKVQNDIVKSDIGTSSSWYYGNYYVWGGKFIGQYKQGSYQIYKDNEFKTYSGVSKKTFNYKDNSEDKKGWRHTATADRPIWPYSGETLTMPAQTHTVGTGDEVSQDECFANPFFTISCVNRIASIYDQPESGKTNYWWSWMPNDNNYNFTIQYNAHDNTGKNSVVIGYTPKA